MRCYNFLAIYIKVLNSNQLYVDPYTICYLSHLEIFVLYRQGGVYKYWYPVCPVKVIGQFKVVPYLIT